MLSIEKSLLTTGFWFDLERKFKLSRFIILSFDKTKQLLDKFYKEVCINIQLLRKISSIE